MMEWTKEKERLILDKYLKYGEIWDKGHIHKLIFLDLQDELDFISDDNLTGEGIQDHFTRSRLMTELVVDKLKKGEWVQVLQKLWKTSPDHRLNFLGYMKKAFDRRGNIEELMSSDVKSNVIKEALRGNKLNLLPDGGSNNLLIDDDEK